MRFGFPELGRRGRSFLREVAIIIIGVLIALALEQLASNWRERQRIADIRASMDEELADFAEVFSIRHRAGRCAAEKLRALEAILRQPGAGGPWRNVGRPPFYFSSQGAWNSDASDVLSRHLGPETYRVYGELYQGMEQFTALLEQEQGYWIVLQTLEQQDEPIAGERRWRLIEATAAAGNANLLLEAIAEQMLVNIRALGVAPNASLASTDLGSTPLCRPLNRGAANG